MCEKTMQMEYFRTKSGKLIAFSIILMGLLNILYFFFGLSLGWGIYFGSLFIFIVGLILVFWGIYKLKLRQKSTTPRYKIMRRALKIGLLIAIISFILVECLIIHSALSYDSPNADYIIILGAALVEDRPSLELRERLDESLEYINKNPDIKIIVSGGKGSDELTSEADVMKKYLVSKGINAGKIIMEDKSSNTFENIRFSKNIITGNSGTDNIKVLVVSNDFHLFRVKLLASRLGLDASGLPARTPLYIIPNHYVREYFAVIKSFLFDRV